MPDHVLLATSAAADEMVTVFAPSHWALVPTNVDGSKLQSLGAEIMPS